jgi:prepilin-type N-terminal cleavage/methylation domain-containing protein
MRMRMHLNWTVKNKKGVTIIELLVALVIGALLIAAIYRTFVGQQKTYIVQEQVVDMQQNVRAAINRMMREIRMAGFGNVDLVAGVNGFQNVITPGANSITIVGALKQISTLEIEAQAGQSIITLASASDASNFDGMAYHRYISIGGLESNIVLSRSGKELTLQRPLALRHPANAPIFKIHAITYGIRDDDGTPVLFRDLYSNTAASQRVTVAENVESLQFEYFDANGNPTANPSDIRRVRVMVTARTERQDSDFKGGDGFRRRTIASNIYVRNMDVSQ